MVPSTIKTHPTLNHVSSHPAIRPSPPAASTWRNPRKAAATSLLFRRRVAHFGGWSVPFLLRHPFFVWFLKDYQKENQSHSWESTDKNRHTHTHISKELRTGEDAPGLRLHSQAWRTRGAFTIPTPRLLSFAASFVMHGIYLRSLPLAGCEQVLASCWLVLKLHQCP